MRKKFATWKETLGPGPGEGLYECKQCKKDTYNKSRVCDWCKVKK